MRLPARAIQRLKRQRGLAHAPVADNQKVRVSVLQDVVDIGLAAKELLASDGPRDFIG